MKGRLVLLLLTALPGAFLAGFMRGSATAAFLEADGQVVIEAENHAENVGRGGKSWTLGTSVSGFAGAGYMAALPNSGTQIDTGYATTSPELRYEVKFATTGTYYVWLRGHADGTADNSVHVGLDGQPQATADRMSLPQFNAWAWFKSTMDGPHATLSVTTAGTHTVNVWMREDGLRLDRVLLTTSSSFVPTGLGPAESAQDTGAPGTGPLGMWVAKSALPTVRAEVGVAALNGKVYVLGGKADDAGFLSTVSVYDPSSNNWTVAAPLPGPARDHLGAATVGGKLYAIGGLTGWPGPSVADVYAYDPATNTWTQKASLPRPRGAMGVAVVNGKIYTAGGLNGGSAVDDVSVYNPATDSWTTLAPLPTARHHLTAEAIGDNVYAIGGRTGALTGPLATNEVYDTTTGAWRPAAPMPTARSGHGSGVLNGRIYAFGGEGSGSPTGIFGANEEYDPATNRWRSVAPMLTPRHGTDGAVIGKTIYAPGGGTSQGKHDSAANEAFTLDLLGSWSTLPALPNSEQRREGGVVVVGGHLYVIGGNKGSETRTSSVLRYDLATRTWAPTGTVASFPGPGLDHVGAVVLGGKIYLIGGWVANPTPDTATLYAYDPGTNTWTQKASMPKSRGAVGAAVHGGKIFVVGGKANGERVGDLTVYDPTTDSWTTKAPMPTARDHVQLVALAGRLYAFGGFIGVYPSGVTAKVEVYDPSTDSWSTAASMPTARADFGVGVVNGRAVLFGGINGGGVTGVNEEYDPVTDSWRTLTTMPAPPRRATVGTAADGIVYAPGGSATENDPSLARFESFAYDSAEPPPPDTTPPTVVSTSPAAGATGVAASANVAATFSEAMDASTVTASTFTLVKEGAPSPVAAAVSYNAASKTATLNPDADLDAGASYTATVKGGSGGVKDMAGNALASDKVWSFTVASAPPPSAGVVYRVNAGGPSLTGSPAWSADTAAAPSPYVNAAATGNTPYSTTTPINMTHASVPAGTPAALFQDERWDGPTAPEMQWDFSVTAGTYEVRLYFAEIYSGAQADGARVFDVSIEGALVLDNLDVFAEVGGYKALVKSFMVTSDANLDIDFGHVVENPAVKAIEVLTTTTGTMSQLGATPASAAFGSVAVNQTQTQQLQLTNLGAAGDPAIVVDATSITGVDAAHFSDSFDDAGSVTLAPGASTTLTVSFKPTTAGAKSSTLNVTHSGTNSPLAVPLSGSGLSPPTGGGVVYRVNAGGPSVTGSPAWSADTAAAPTPYVNAAATGNTTFAVTNAINMTHPSVPAGTPAALFQTERWDGPATPELQWDFPVTAGKYEVRLYFAEIYSGAQAIGARVFDVSIEGQLVLDNLDVFAEVGGYKGLVKSFTVTSDANLDIDFGHVVENPAVKGIEILTAAATPNQLGATPATVAFGSVVVNQTQTQQLQLTNLGSAGDPAIVVDATSITGVDAAHFSDSFDDAGSVTLAPGASTPLTVSFKPTTTGAKSATLSVVHSGANSPLGVPLSGSGASSTPVAFGKSLLSGASSQQATSLQFGPDGRLYVAQQDGFIKAYTIARNGPNSYAVTATETISAVRSIQNHNDDGSLNLTVTDRIITGILVTGTSTNLVIYATSSDPRIGGGSSGTDLGLDTNSSMLSRLTWTGSSWQKLDLVRGLPRSEENHSANGMQLDPATNTLYIAQGGNTNMGAKSNNFALLPEYALSAAVLAVNLTAIGNTTYDLPTLDDDSRGGTVDFNDPFGGNDGKNQAKLVPGGPVKVHAPGFRNPYDLVITKSGHMYTIDNGGNAGWGDTPVNEGPAGNCTNGVKEPGTTQSDTLHLISSPGYYGGHPNPTRANPANTFNANNQSPVPSGNAVECDFRYPGLEQGNLTSFPASTNGLAEYTASNFGGTLKGDLLAASFNNAIYRIDLDSTGTSANASVLFANVGSTPLDVVAQGDAGPFPGTIWAADINNGSITVFEPNDYSNAPPPPPCGGQNSTTLDEDGDGFKNADEIANGTNPCSAADVPPDQDGDKVSDLNDPDDDNDGQPDTSDPFAIDAQNGTTTTLPVRFTWDNDAPKPGGLLNLGFTGLMTNGSANYQSLFDPAEMTAGGAAGVTTVDKVPEGDALGAANTQEYGFQFGVKPPQTGTFTAHTRILSPFAGLMPQDSQSMGLFLGTGNQDNYVKIVVSANGGSGGIQFLKEVGGTVTSRPQAAAALPGPSAIDLYLTVDPVAQTVLPSYSVGTNGTRVNLGSAEPIPSGWLASTTALAVGIISTSAGPAPEFPTTWDLIEIEVDAPTDTTPPTVTQTSPAAGASSVAASANVEATFSEAMDAASITTGTFTLQKQGAAGANAAAVTYDAATKKAILNPSADLEAGATYTATVKGGAGGVKDVAGNALTVDKVWSFTVAAAPPPVQQGLKGDYFNNQDLTALALTRVDPTVKFNWGTGSPHAAIAPDTFSVRWTGEVKADHSQVYTFSAVSDDGVRLWVGGTLVINNWTVHPPTENTGTIALQAGQWYPVKLEYFEAGGGAVISLSYASPSTPKQIIPADHLRPPA